jgi:HlyD family secretion protein
MTGVLVWLRRPAVLAGLAVAAVLVTSCSGDPDPVVETSAVGRSTVVEVVEAPAAVAARATATVTATASGTVASLEVADGDQVERGEVLLRLRSPSAQKALRQAEAADRQAASSSSVSLPRADLSASQQQADAAAASAFRAARQAAKAIPDSQARQQALAQVAQAQAAYAAARAQGRRATDNLNSGVSALERSLASLARTQRQQTALALAAAQATVDGLVVRSPLSGVVALGATAGSGSDASGLLGSLPESLQGTASSLLGGSTGGSSTSGTLTVGAPVSAGSTIATVTDISVLSVTASVDETDVLLVSPGVKADIELDAVPDATYAGEVTSVDLQPTSSSRGGVSYVVRLTLDGGTAADGSPAPVPRPGMSAVARLLVREAVDVVAVPAAAVFRDGDGDAVWVVVDGTVERRAVRLGAQGVDSIEIAEGLVEGETVVVRGADQVRSGQSLP